MKYGLRTEIGDGDDNEYEMVEKDSDGMKTFVTTEANDEEPKENEKPISLFWSKVRSLCSIMVTTSAEKIGTDRFPLLSSVTLPKTLQAP